MTSLGLHQVAINGRPVSDDLLAPGWSPYRHRLIAETYDVTACSRPGPTSSRPRSATGGIAGASDGTPRVTAPLRPGGCARRPARGRARGRDAPSRRHRRGWLASTGEIRSADLYDGAVVDLREAQPGWTLPGHDDAGGSPVAVVPFDHGVLEPRSPPPVRAVADAGGHDPTRAATRPLDGGQNIAGFVRLTVRGRARRPVTVRHAEVLEPDGSLHVRALRTARGDRRLRPCRRRRGRARATVHVPWVPVCRGRDPRERPRRRNCGDQQRHRDGARRSVLRRRSQPPPRERRLVATGQLRLRPDRLPATRRAPRLDGRRPGLCPDGMHAVRLRGRSGRAGCAIWSSSRTTTLGVPSVVPDVVLDGEPRFGRAGWADAATIVPWAVYESYGDPESSAASSTACARGSDRSSRRRARRSAPTGDAVWRLARPRRAGGSPWQAKTDADFLANAFFAHGARLLADAARLGDRSATETDGTWPTRSRRYLGRWAEHADDPDRLCCRAAVRPGARPDRAASGPRWPRSSARAEGVSRPDSSARRWCSRPSRVRALRRGLPDAPAPRHAVVALPGRQGATTVWERWDAILPDGSIHPGTMSPPQEVPESGEAHMLSFNHYAYGAVIDWVYRHVAGHRARSGQARLPARGVRAGPAPGSTMPAPRSSHRMAPSLLPGG